MFLILLLYSSTYCVSLLCIYVYLLCAIVAKIIIVQCTTVETDLLLLNPAREIAA